MNTARITVRFEIGYHDGSQVLMDRTVATKLKTQRDINTLGDVFLNAWPPIGYRKSGVYRRFSEIRYQWLVVVPQQPALPAVLAATSADSYGLAVLDGRHAW
jgi:hypothetical protein